MKRILLFVVTNLAVIIVLSIVLSILMPVLGLDQASTTGLLFICSIFGMGGERFFSVEFFIGAGFRGEGWGKPFFGIVFGNCMSRNSRSVGLERFH